MKIINKYPIILTCLLYTTQGYANPELSLAQKIAQYRPVSSVITRIPFGQCLIKAIWNTLCSKQESMQRFSQGSSPQQVAHNLHKALVCNDQIDPKTFLWGAGTSAHQVEGGCSPEICSWARWEHEHVGLNDTAQVQELSGAACNHWNMYTQDIALLKKSLGLNSYRFSVEWAKIEPTEGKFDQAVLDHYAQVCAHLVAQGIKPVIGLHHYTDPCWFMDKGGFAKEENITYFIRFADTLFAYLYKHIYKKVTDPHLLPMISTFNSPSGYAAKGYWAGVTPPGIKNDMQQMVAVLKNMLEAHVGAYTAIKKIGGPSVQVGILKNMYQLNTRNGRSFLSHLGCSAGEMLQNEGIFGFFTTGHFNIYMPTKAHISHYNPQAPYSLDFIGLNYYSNGYMKGFSKDPAVEPDVTKRTANPNYRIYPQGLYLAIKELSERMAKPIEKIQNRPIPIYITENGIAPLDDNDMVRASFYHNYLSALTQAIQEGFDVRGYITWSLMDNYEWGSSYTGNDRKPYGLLKVNFSDGSLTRTVKAGAHYLKDLITTFKEKAHANRTQGFQRENKFDKTN